MASKKPPQEPLQILRTFLVNRRYSRTVRYQPLTSRHYLDISWIIVNGQFLTEQIAGLLKLLPKLSILEANGPTYLESAKKVLELNLERLNVSQSQLGNDLLSVQKMTSLRILDMDQCAIDDTFVLALTPLKQLHTLSIANNFISQFGIQTLIQSNKQLIHLNISGNQHVQDTGVIYICKNLPKLEFLNISGCTVTSRGASYLPWLNLLEELVLQEKYQQKNNFLDDNSILKVFRNMKHLKKLVREMFDFERANRSIKVVKKKSID